MTESAILIQSHSSYDLEDFSCQSLSQDYYYHDDHQHQKSYHAAHDNQSQLSYKMKLQVKKDHMIILKELSCWSACSKIISSQSTSVFCSSLDLTSSIANTASLLFLILFQFYLISVSFNSFMY